MEVFFYNTFHNGDVHYSRTFVRDIMKKLGDTNNYTYLHNNNPKILKDIQNLKYDKAFISFDNWNLISSYPISYFNQIIYSSHNVFINTWVGQQNWITRNGVNRNRNNQYCSIYSLFELYQDIFDYFKIEIENIDYYLPTIDFDFIEKSEIDIFLKNNNFRKILLFCNNQPLTIRIDLDFVEVVDNLSDKYEDILFVLSNKDGKILDKKNVKYFCDIINIKPDFNELAYFSTYCDVIVGKPSGPYTFTMIKENFLDEKKTFITISDNIYDGFYLNGKSEMILLKEHNMKSLVLEIDKKMS